jgi:hypothetical protein
MGLYTVVLLQNPVIVLTYRLKNLNKNKLLGIIYIDRQYEWLQNAPKNNF